MAITDLTYNISEHWNVIRFWDNTNETDRRKNICRSIRFKSKIERLNVQIFDKSFFKYTILYNLIKIKFKRL